MDSYTDFASVYDTFMDETPYAEWCDYIEQKLNSYNVPKGLVADLGCGTGVMTRMLRDRGYDMIGIDNSPQMLTIAKESEHDDSILYLCQDMCEFELYGTVGAIISVCDSVNYILGPDDLRTTFELVNNYLDPDGIFIFDFNTEYKYRDVIGETTIAENRDDCSFIWENYYDEETHINEYDLTLFVSADGDGLYRKSVETHLQRGYTVDEMTNLVKSAGLELLETIDADTHSAVTATSERVYIIARERGKKK